GEEAGAADQQGFCNRPRCSKQRTLRNRIRNRRQARLRHFDQPGKQRGASGQLRDEDVLVGGVGSVAYTAEAVEGGDAQCSGEVAIGASADRSLTKLPSQFARDSFGLLEESGHSGSALHGRTVDASGDLNFAFAVEGAQGAHFLIDTSRIFYARDTDVDARGSVRWNHVGSRSAGDDADIDGEALLQVGESGDFFDLAGEFDNGVRAPLEIEAGVRCLAGDLQEV